MLNDGRFELIATLRVYHDRMQRRRQSVLALGSHPNALDYRFDRIERLLGISHRVA